MDTIQHNRYAMANSILSKLLEKHQMSPGQQEGMLELMLRRLNDPFTRTMPPYTTEKPRTLRM